MRIFKNLSGQRVSESRYFKIAITKARELLKDPDELRKFIDRVKARATKLKGTDLWEPLMACVRLLRADVQRKYTDIPWQSLLLITAAIVYFLMPFDLIPDFIVGLGLIDDLALMGWALRSVKSDIDAFREWERQQDDLKA